MTLRRLFGLLKTTKRTQSWYRPTQRGAITYEQLYQGHRDVALAYREFYVNAWDEMAADPESYDLGPDDAATITDPSQDRTAIQGQPGSFFWDCGSVGRPGVWIAFHDGGPAPTDMWSIFFGKKWYAVNAEDSFTPAPPPVVRLLSQLRDALGIAKLKSSAGER